MGSRITVDDLLDELTEMVQKAVKLPLANGRVVLDSRDIMGIVEDIRASIPKESRQARAIVADRGQIIGDAKREAETIIRVAEEKARALVDQNVISKQAQEKSNQLLMQTQQKCREMRKASNEYVDDLMKRTDESIAANLAELRRTHQNIRASQRSGLK